jgi:hypothetical protein
MRFSAMMILMTGTLMACGGSGDVCQQAESLDQAQADKVKSCGADNSTILADLATLQQTCETNIKSCTATDISAYSSDISCQQSLDSTVQCQWFTEADASTDQSFETYETASTNCDAKVANVTAACANGFM